MLLICQYFIAERGEKMQKKERIIELVEYLNRCCDEYYNQNAPSISDAMYDALFDELSALEKETGYVLPNSPTVRPGYEVLSELKKVEHTIPLLSLAKTKNPADVLDMAKKGDGYLALKLDGLTVKITYRGGKIVEAATRGDGAVGEDITHNAKVFKNVPKTVPFESELVISGEAFIDIETFNSINESIDTDEEKYSTPRNLASGSVRQLDSSVCAKRRVSFIPFNVLSGMENVKSKLTRLKKLNEIGFELIPNAPLDASDTEESTTEKIFKLKTQAENRGFPIDGIVFSYDNTDFAAAQGRTSHHFKDGIAFKFGDPHFETTLKDILWNISRTGQLTPIADFNAVEIDNTNVERASLHNITFIENLKLIKGDKILVSKRNMIIPHIEKNLSAEAESRTEYLAPVPEICPVCGGKTVIKTTENSGSEVKVLFCENKLCPGRQIKKFTHFVSKPALNIDGLSEATLQKFISLGWIKELADIFCLANHKDEIIKMEGFGQKSFENLSAAIESAKVTTLANLIVAFNIPQLGKSAALLIEDMFKGSMENLLAAIDSGFDFSAIEGFGEITNALIYEWFNLPENRLELNNVLKTVTLKFTEKSIDNSNPFFGKTVVITGTFKDFTRDELSAILTGKGAKVSSAVSSKTDYVLCGENAGSKLTKARDLGITVITESELNI